MFLESWGATSDEISGAVVGDDIIPNARVSATRCITIAASPDEVFPWIRQMGFGRAGWYSYDWIDNLGKKSARSVNPEWQDIITDSLVPAGPGAIWSIPCLPSATRNRYPDNWRKLDICRQRQLAIRTCHDDFPHLGGGVPRGNLVKFCRRAACYQLCQFACL